MELTSVCFAAVCYLDIGKSEMKETVIDKKPLFVHFYYKVHFVNISLHRLTMKKKRMFILTFLKSYIIKTNIKNIIINILLKSKVEFGNLT